MRKLCCRPGCDELSEDGGPHCPDCAAKEAARLAKRKALAKTSTEAMAGSALYATSRWQRESRAFLAKHPLCADCADLGAVIEATEVDHIEPHRGDRTLFFNRKNWQPLCKSCHSRKTAREVFHRGGIPKIPAPIP